MYAKIYQERIIFSSKGKTIYRFLQFILNYWRTIPCQIAYLISKQKYLVNSDFGSYNNMVKSLIFGKHNRNLFYHRMGKSSYIYSWILRGEPSLKIPFNCPIGKHAHFVHNDCCYLNAQSIGENFICYPHVVIGAKNLIKNEKPIIGNDVTIGTGTVIVGNITIGNNVTISANSFICKNIPNNAVIIGNPAKIIKLNNQKVNILL